MQDLELVVNQMSANRPLDPLNKVLAPSTYMLLV